MKKPTRYNDVQPFLLIGIVLLPFLTFLGAGGCGGGGSMPAATGETPTPTPAASALPVASASPSVAPTATPLPDGTPSPVVTASPTPTPEPIRVSVTPETATMSVGDTAQLMAQVTGASDPAVIWSIDDAGGGTVTQSGVYTAPTLPGTYHVRASSKQDVNHVAFATIIVQAGNANGSIH